MAGRPKLHMPSMYHRPFLQEVEQVFKQSMCNGTNIGRKRKTFISIHKSDILNEKSNHEEGSSYVSKLFLL